MPVFDDPMPVAIVTLFHHITLIISLAIKIQTMIVAPSGITTRPRDASASSICFIIRNPPTLHVALQARQIYPHQLPDHNKSL